MRLIIFIALMILALISNGAVKLKVFSGGIQVSERDAPSILKRTIKDGYKFSHYIGQAKDGYLFKFTEDFLSSKKCGSKGFVKFKRFKKYSSKISSDCSEKIKGYVSKHDFGNGKGLEYVYIERTCSLKRLKTERSYAMVIGFKDFKKTKNVPILRIFFKPTRNNIAWWMYNRPDNNLRNGINK